MSAQNRPKGPNDIDNACDVPLVFSQLVGFIALGQWCAEHAQESASTDIPQGNNHAHPKP